MFRENCGRVENCVGASLTRTRLASSRACVLCLTRFIYIHATLDSPMLLCFLYEITRLLMTPVVAFLVNPRSAHTPRLCLLQGNSQPLCKYITRSRSANALPTNSLPSPQSQRCRPQGIDGASSSCYCLCRSESVRVTAWPAPC